MSVILQAVVIVELNMQLEMKLHTDVEDVTVDEEFDEFEDALVFLQGYLRDAKKIRYASISGDQDRLIWKHEVTWRVNFSGIVKNG